MTSACRTSIVVITRDRPARLDAALGLLARQAADELVVVDDGSEDGAAVAAAARRNGARVVRQAAAGMATARNTGALHARGEHLLFTDDDCVPSPGWAAALAARLQAGADVVAGPTHAGRPDRALDRAWQLIADELVAWHEPAQRFMPGSNFGAHAAALAAVPFDAGFDGVGAEDRDWWARVHERGLRVAYVPEASVDHRPDLGLVRFARKQVRYGRGAYRFRKRHHGGRAGPLGFYRRLGRSALRAGPAVASLVVLAQAATAAGFTAEAVTQRRLR